MEMERNSRRGGRNQSSSSSSSSSSSKHQSNSTRHGRPLNPNSKNDQNWDKPTTTTTGDGVSKNTGSTHKQNQEKFHDVDDDDASFKSLPSLVGTCPFMCPSEERAQRERLQDLAVFERLYGNPRKSSSSLAVKKFCRTISTKHMQASDMRPLPVLEDTLNYLLNLLDSSVHPFEVIHDFIFDRTRSIRQDLSMQNIIGERAINMFEKMVNFYIVSHHKLQTCSDSPNTSPLHHLNMEQLTKALTSLYNLYEANRSSDSIYENEAEFRSFYVLLHLGSDSQSMGESLSLWFRRVPSAIIKSKEMSFARKVLRYFRLGNYKRFICTTAAEASYLQFCIIKPYINEVRVLALSSVNYGGYKLHPYPLEDLSKLLMIKGSEMESFCNDCGLETLTDEVGKKFLPAKQTSFHHPKRRFLNYCLSGSERLDRFQLIFVIIKDQGPVWNHFSNTRVFQNVLLGPKTHVFDSLDKF